MFLLLFAQRETLSFDSDLGQITLFLIYYKSLRMNWVLMYHLVEFCRYENLNDK